MLVPDKGDKLQVSTGAWGAPLVSGSQPLDQGKSSHRILGVCTGLLARVRLPTLLPFNPLIHCVLKGGSTFLWIITDPALNFVTANRKQELGPKPAWTPSS